MKDQIIEIAKRLSESKQRLNKADAQVAAWEIEKKAAGKAYIRVCEEFHDACVKWNCTEDLLEERVIIAAENPEGGM